MIEISTDCVCSDSNFAADLEYAGVPADRAQAFTDASKSATSNNMYLISTLTNYPSEMKITATTAMVNTPLCGGLNMTSMPVCTTTFANHSQAIVMMEYMTDGTTASIAQKDVRVRELTEAADLNTWAFGALSNILGSGVIKVALPSQIPAMMSPLLWWTTADLMAIDPALLGAGLETMYTILFRAGVQRSYSTAGQQCVREIVNPTLSKISMQDYGYKAALSALIIQLVFNAVSIAAFIPWIFCKSPAGPAIRAMNESIYFTTLLADSNLSDNLKGLCNAPTYAIWQALDVSVRIGESIMTQDDAVGHITMDKPKVVRPLVNARRYA